MHKSSSRVITCLLAKAIKLLLTPETPDLMQVVDFTILMEVKIHRENQTWCNLIFHDQAWP